MTSLRSRDTDNGTDADIGGAGVIIGAILANLLTLLASIVAVFVWRHKRRGNEGYQLLGFPVRSWAEVLPDFILSLSDQQLLTGLVLLIVGLGTFYESSVHEGANNLWVAGDIVMFSSVTHPAILIALRPYFRKHRALASIRVILMWMTFALWLVVAVGILSQDKPKHSAKLPFWLAEFWRAAAYIDAFGVSYMYCITYLPIFISERAANVRELVARDKHIQGDIPELDDWESHKRIRRTNTSERPFFSRLLKRVSPYKIARSFISLAFKRFAKHYVRAEGVWYRRFLWMTAEIIFPWRLTIVPVGVMWIFGLLTMVLNLWQGGNLSTWDFGQLISPIMTILPIYNLAVVVARSKTQEKDTACSDSGATDSQSDQKRYIATTVSRNDKNASAEP
ncbi:MAG: hypothetical protein M1828_000781 [Chrysothrix sp. TS-e1954]|nr:MAG: hypothetical protein M1828_000781 [Chrysothrix sp. TS-e1954]